MANRHRQSPAEARVWLLCYIQRHEAQSIWLVTPKIWSDETHIADRVGRTNDLQLPRNTLVRVAVKSKACPQPIADAQDDTNSFERPNHLSVFRSRVFSD